ncbi:MAG: LON peptidase substrate-binding domain-containing protein [Alphaproteobacteria bacterium]
MLYSFEDNLGELPKTIPLFPLNKVLLLPRAKLPLNLFENRYLHMFDYALKNQKVIGMIQPKEKLSKDSEIKNPVLYDVGCAGRITAFSETNDNRYELILKGTCRFRIKKEKKVINGFRSADVTWEEFGDDFEITNLRSRKKRTDFESLLKVFLKKISINADWEMVDTTNDEDLVNMISMCSPFDVSEKQALLEANVLEERLEILMSLMEMGLNENKMVGSGNPS